MQPTIASTPRQISGQWRKWLLLEKESPSLLDALAPGLNLAQKLAIAIAFIAIVALLARARFFLPDNPVPITFQTFGILMMGGVLGWRWGIFSGAGYYLVGMVGLPVFAGGGSGWGAVNGATGGYLLGFILATALVGFLSQHGWNRSRSIWPMLIGGLILYVPALIWLSVRDYGWPADGELFSAAMYPFIPGDLVKLMLAALVIGAAWKYADYRHGRRGGPRV
ncbi:MAG: biotin transporter BioY [Chloroflexi bacterium]|nr:biotin transporter BioY [Chloroflexota bacterium]